MYHIVFIVSYGYDRDKIFAPQDTYFWQIADMIGVQQKFLQTPGVTQNVVGDARQRAMTFVNVFHLPVTPFKNRNAAEHGTTLYSHRIHVSR